MKLHHIRPVPGVKTAKAYVSRGEGSKGKTAGCDTESTKARCQVSAGFEGGRMPVHVRLPELYGFRSPFRVGCRVVNVARLAELFPRGSKMTVEDLITEHAMRDNVPVRVLGSGELTAKLEVEVDAWSVSVAKKIQAVGGTISAR